MPPRKSRTPKETSGNRLAALRRSRGMSQRELAKLTGISNRMIAYYETQAEALPEHALAKIAQALGASTDHLLGLKSDQPTTPTFSIDTRVLRRLLLFERLPPTDRRYILKQIEILARQAGIDVDDAA
jgi:transcriptional regulator with XRE-family HTH domain